MDNLTHSLGGAVLGRMGLKRLSPRAMPALIIAANLPDIDSFVARGVGCEPIAAAAALPLPVELAPPKPLGRPPSSSCSGSSASA